MKKLFTLFLLLVASAEMMYATPTQADLQSYMENGYYVACFQAPADATCNDIYWMGEYCSWNISTPLENLVKCIPLQGANAGWYVAKVPAANGDDGKPIQLNEYGQLTWDVQPGTAAQTTLISGYVNIFANGSEYDLKDWSTTEPTIITIGSWKNGYNPCELQPVQIGDLYYILNASQATAEVTSNSYSGEVVIPSTVTYKDVTYSVTSIGGGAFYGCIGLASVTIGNSVTSIGTRAFYGCTGLTSVTIPNSVTSIGQYAFFNVPNIVYNGNASGSPWDARCVNGYADGWLVYSDNTQTTLVGCPSIATGKITIPNSVTSIGVRTFQYCSGLTSITIPNSVISIGDDAFGGCSGLTSVTIPNSVTSIGNNAFNGCSGLTSITILGETPASLGSWAFDDTNNCPIYVPCGTLDAYKYKSAWSVYTSRIKYVSLSHNVQVNVNLHEAGVVNKPITICDDTIISAVPNYGYHFVQWNDGNKDNPRTIWLSQDTTFTAEFAISRTGTCGDNNLLTWTYNPDVKALTISGNGSLNSNYTFGLEAPTNIQKLEILSGVTSIGNSAFANEENITSIKLPNTLTTIGDHAFVGCKKLNTITIPESVTTIGQAAFKNGNRLETIILGADIETISDSAFANCPYILSVYAHMEYPPVINASVFVGDGDLSLVDLFVPESAITRYRKTAVWKEFNLQAGQEPEPQPEDIYTITYIGKDDVTLDSENVTLHLPEAPEIEGFTFQKWVFVAGDVINGLTVQAIYEANAPTSAPAVYTNPANPAQKLIRNGNVYILTGYKTYTVTGQEVR